MKTTHYSINHNPKYSNNNAWVFYFIAIFSSIMSFHTVGNVELCWGILAGSSLAITYYKISE
jgi:hypothetical protein